MRGKDSVFLLKRERSKNLIVLLRC